MQTGKNGVSKIGSVSVFLQDWVQLTTISALSFYKGTSSFSHKKESVPFWDTCVSEWYTSAPDC
jgi:hypothetical protein